MGLEVGNRWVGCGQAETLYVLRLGDLEILKNLISLVDQEGQLSGVTKTTCYALVFTKVAFSTHPIENKL